MTVNELVENPDIIKEELAPADALHFYCPVEDGSFTFVLQKDGKVYPYTSKIDPEAFNNVDTLENVFKVFAKSIYNSTK